ncbi:hypothetical protein QAD02_009483 [Eretmocerus hayati]|uniref:Uncharacterized protein n=1 Tax=Eretmocerus hayati TaxID=131215 RepID=A0ACC2N9I7_9HYME|nr:hypothetical protein QAD02_009483 [Eretmocerus hayati]
MPFFKIELFDGSQSVMFKAESIEEILDKSTERMGLLKEGVNYDILLDDKKTKIDEDVIEFAKVSATLVQLILRPVKDVLDNRDGQLCAPVEKPLEDNPQSPSSDSTVFISLRDIFGQIDRNIVCKCEKGEKLLFEERAQVSNRCAEYMKDTLKNTTRGVGTKIATAICQRYSRTFDNRVENEVWGSGVATLRLSIMNVIYYRKESTPKKRPVQLCDSDEEEIAAIQSQYDNSLLQDEYGYVQYSPSLPEGETLDTQNDKRLELLSLFEEIDDHDSEKVSKLMKSTYATQRIAINNQSRNIPHVLTEWPFLKNITNLIEHSDTLLGKKVESLWRQSFEDKATSMRKYLKSCPILTCKKRVNQVQTLVEEYKKAEEYNRSELPKFMVIFHLMLLYFGEEESPFFKIVDKKFTDQDVMKLTNTMCPTLIIRGSSLYDENSVCTVVLEHNTIIFCNSPLQGILATLLAYYVFGYVYPPAYEKSLEFLQRVFLRIIPKEDSITPKKKKKKGSPFEASVMKLATALADFTNKFKITQT